MPSTTKKINRKGLTLKEQAFVNEFMVDLNGTAACIRAKYAPKNAHVTASKFLSNPKIQDAIAEAQLARQLRLEITADRVVLELARLGMSNMRNYLRFTTDGDPIIDLNGISEDAWSAIQELTIEDVPQGRGDDARDVRRIKLRLVQKAAPLRDLAKYLGVLEGNKKHQPALHTPETMPEPFIAEEEKDRFASMADEFFARQKPAGTNGSNGANGNGATH